jgi:hypothetical protein
MIGAQRKTVFIDRNSGGHSFRHIIQKANISVVLHDEKFNKTTPDSVWVKKLGALDWMMVTGDQAIERNYLFLEDLRRTTAHVFILCGLNHATPEGRAKVIIDAYDEMLALCHTHCGPRLWKAKAGAKILPVDFRHSIGMLKRYKRTAQ